jgi:hypothetical protein
MNRAQDGGCKLVFEDTEIFTGQRAGEIARDKRVVKHKGHKGYKFRSGNGRKLLAISRRRRGHPFARRSRTDSPGK